MLSGIGAPVYFDVHAVSLGYGYQAAIGVRPRSNAKSR